MTEAVTGLLAMLLLSLLRIPIALSMAIVGVVGYAYMRDWNWAPAFASLQTRLYETGRNYTLSVVPLFILMGNFVTRAGMSQELFRAAYAFIGHLRGGLAMATILACAGFGAICGSSIATAATMAKVAYPSMRRFGYSDTLATGAIASGGTLGIMIPPSTLLVIYGVFTETNIGMLFAAGMGAFGAMVFALWRRVLNWKSLYQALVESARTTSMLFMILIGALMFAEFVNITTMPNDLVAFVKQFEIHPVAVVAAICIIYVLLGTAMEELSMVLLTIPVFLPVILQLGFDPIWFGILIVCVVEIGLISPPVGMNLFVLKTLIPGVAQGTVFRGVLPFMLADVIRMAILIAFPAISLYLPGLMR